MHKSVATALDVLRDRGPGEVVRVSIEKAAMWWRLGDPIDLRKLIGRPSPVARLDGCRFELDASEMSENLRYLLLSGKHEKPERMLVRRFLDPTLPVVDLGGSIGVVSCITNRKMRHPRLHVVVEANPSLIPLLVRNRNANRCHFTVLNRAIGYGGARLRLHVSPNVLASTVYGESDTTIDVETTTLGAILDDQGYQRCNLVCDIEGAEADLVRNEAGTLSAHVDMFIVEVHERLIGTAPTQAMLRTLSDAGFETAGREWDAVALRNTRRERTPAARGSIA
jgi:FkbM family methyltransferase